MVLETAFTPVTAIIGGAMIGLAALVLMWSVGRIAGISGIVAGAILEAEDERNWRLLFLAGLFIGALIASVITGALDDVSSIASTPVLIVAGLLVGIGTRMGGGCTSGHGVCGISRFSQRSIVATAVFMASGAATVFVIRHLLGEGV
ncbi:YeeE/YedE family protein [Zhongshania sp.]|uniref:YeeE/YedE family protein n=1 Tax=Zhongshania sp. TaxID=1971902 RepID=UPI001B590508|nr:YeeE/YedE family protein [Zhongshania sp.]MBQ0796688.1 YeeE/YedE family protein [Zhongshania sp.]|tara:strand:- start:7703 stop:8143 length:441 start_codon:yes stop_codon:yes gene_type:complete